MAGVGDAGQTAAPAGIALQRIAVIPPRAAGLDRGRPPAAEAGAERISGPAGIVRARARGGRKLLDQPAVAHRCCVLGEGLGEDLSPSCAGHGEATEDERCGEDRKTRHAGELRSGRGR